MRTSVCTRRAVSCSSIPVFGTPPAACDRDCLAAGRHDWRQRIVNLPRRHDRVDLALAERGRHRDAMVAVTDEVHLADLDQLDRRELDPIQPRAGHLAPALRRVRLAWIERSRERVRRPSLPRIWLIGTVCRPAKCSPRIRCAWTMAARSSSRAGRRRSADHSLNHHPRR